SNPDRTIVRPAASKHRIEMKHAKLLPVRATFLTIAHATIVAGPKGNGSFKEGRPTVSNRVGRAVLCPPQKANRARRDQRAFDRHCHSGGAHGVTRPTILAIVQLALDLASRRASTAPPVIPALSPSFDAIISTPFIVPGIA